MLCRIYPTQQLILNQGEKVEYIYFIEEGYISVCEENRLTPLVQMKSGSWFGDANVLLDLQSNFRIQTDDEISNLM